MTLMSSLQIILSTVIALNILTFLILLAYVFLLFRRVLSLVPKVESAIKKSTKMQNRVSIVQKSMLDIGKSKEAIMLKTADYMRNYALVMFSMKTTMNIVNKFLARRSNINE